jgi:hypothetical protein
MTSLERSVLLRAIEAAKQALADAQANLEALTTLVNEMETA